MTIEELTRKHPEYAARNKDWTKWRSCYDGIAAIIDAGLFQQHERESDDNYDRRKKAAMSFDVCHSIVDLFTQFLFSQTIERDWNGLDENELFAMFLQDSDMDSTSFPLRMQYDSAWAAVYGSIGYVIDSPQDMPATVAEQTALRVYPYITRYFPPAILEWETERILGRKTLTWLKLQEDDSHYKIWTRENWELWKYDPKTDATPTLEGSAAHDLGEIPFIRVCNIPDPDSYMFGVSDLRGLSDFELSLVENISQGEEIIGYAAFPMMRKPYKKAGEDPNDDTGPTAILEFDPEYPESKADWLEAKVSDPLTALMEWMQIKVQRAYKSMHAADVAGVEDREAKSGVALKMEFTELGAALRTKASAFEHAERQIIRLWAKWQKVAEKVKIQYPAEFDFAELAEELGTLLLAKSLVPSLTFAQAVGKHTTRQALPKLTPEDLEAIDSELEAAGPELLVDQLEPEEPEVIDAV